MLTITVEPEQRVVHYRDGRLVGVLEPGRYRRRRRSRYVPVDIRQQLTPTAPQEVLTSDGVSVKVSATVRWAITEPATYLQAAGDPFSFVYLAVQVALREQLSGFEVAELLSSARETVTDAITAAAVEACRPLGIAVETVVIKDVIVPAEPRAAYAELVTTKQRAQAQLEAARAETAALRSMANGAKLLDEHPALARLRMIQAAPYGTKIILGDLPAAEVAGSDD
ncbi:MAG TPA: slipin family protein [Microlunatus sp.]|nr:slipin family protein [Microlunatus sp.]